MYLCIMWFISYQTIISKFYNAIIRFRELRQKFVVSCRSKIEYFTYLLFRRQSGRGVALYK